MKVLVIYHTIYGHTLQLARAVTEGVKSVAGVEAVFRRAPEFPHTEKELEAGEGYATQIWKEQRSIPPCTLDDLREADGLLLGSPTRYGNMTAQMNWNSSRPEEPSQPRLQAAPDPASSTTEFRRPVEKGGRS